MVRIGEDPTSLEEPLAKFNFSFSPSFSLGGKINTEGAR
jgi:hypothetical protein